MIIIRLWHQKLIPYLPRQQLLGQHRECCALRGAGWGKKHSIVNYVFNYDPSYLVAYHYLVMNEMERRGYKPDKIWRDPTWRGNKLGQCDGWANIIEIDDIIYPEHNNEYLNECLDNLKNKGIILDLKDA